MHSVGSRLKSPPGFFFWGQLADLVLAPCDLEWITEKYGSCIKSAITAQLGRVMRPSVYAIYTTSNQIYLRNRRSNHALFCMPIYSQYPMPCMSECADWSDPFLWAHDPKWPYCMARLSYKAKHATKINKLLLTAGTVIKLPFNAKHSG